jgi:hypothetical protein
LKYDFEVEAITQSQPALLKLDSQYFPYLKIYALSLAQNFRLRKIDCRHRVSTPENCFQESTDVRYKSGRREVSEDGALPALFRNGATLKMSFPRKI